jgi:heme/copper-type cytochrome/quinol oxidase subunit 4
VELISAGQWCWPVVLPSVAVQFVGQIAVQFIARRARPFMHMFECMVNSSSPLITITTIITIIIISMLTRWCL